ncbi:MAG: T9SS type A sorting domain-containing protein, partial [Bacteroidota bacterium]
EPVTYQLDVAALNKFIGVSGDTKARNSDNQKAATRQTGFLAQDVEKVAKAISYDFSGVDAPKNENDPYALRYAEFVVPLVKAVQELDTKNEQLEAKIEQLENTLYDLKKLVEQAAQQPNADANPTETVTVSDAQLFQNEPNPFEGSTTIRYRIPQKIRSATLHVTNNAGQLLRTIPVQARGLGQTILKTETLSNGVYYYTLMLEGLPIATKKMVVQ